MRLKRTAIKIRNYFKESLKEKVEIFSNPKKIYAEFVKLGKKEGLPFMYYAICVEVAEDVVLPVILGFTGHAEYIPVVLALHSEPVMYPLWFLGRRIHKKAKKRKVKQVLLLNK